MVEGFSSSTLRRTRPPRLARSPSPTNVGEIYFPPTSLGPYRVLASRGLTRHLPPSRTRFPMRKFTPVAAALVLALAAAPAAFAAAKTPMVGGAAMYPTKNI